MNVHNRYEVNFSKRIVNLETEPSEYPELDVTFDTSESTFVTDLIDYLECNIGYKGGMAGLSIVQKYKHANSPSYICFKQMEDANGVENPNGRFQAEYRLTINSHLVRGVTSSELSRLFKDAGVSDQNNPDDIAENIMWFRRGIDDAIDQFTTKYPDVTEPSSFPMMAKLSLILNGESLDLPLTSDIADALHYFLRAVKTEV
ncbi:hypothetical protein [Paenibacillus sp. Y412MC10]|uniref:hypothetical protein n=1 Tax=Geobacillus sp. (strain Y412MC10) TaxID=481743 RepID=UPI0011A497C3|nr:hypothetical protein [Paenibacillus sp. Y412MC10]